MALSLYLDDCANSDLLADSLVRAGHVVVRPEDAGTAREADDVHFRYAGARGPGLVTKNPKDFLALHSRDPNHPGIFAIYQDNDPSRDMSPGDIVAAIQKIEEAVLYGYVIAGEFHNLNAWQ